MKTIILGLIMFISPALLNAEPDANIKYLMDTKVSLFSFGLYRMEGHLNGLRDHSRPLVNIKGIINVKYDSYLNRIFIVSRILPNPKLPTKSNTEICRKEIGVIRRLGGIGKNSYYSYLFSPVGYEPKINAKDLYRKIDNIISIKIMIAGKKGFNFSCEGALVSKEILYREN